MAPGRADRTPRRGSASVARRAAAPTVGVRGRCVALHGTRLRDTFHLGAHQRSPTCLTWRVGVFPARSRHASIGTSGEKVYVWARRLATRKPSARGSRHVAVFGPAARGWATAPCRRPIRRPKGGQVVVMPLSACRRASRILRRHRRRVGVRAGIPGRGRSVRVAARAAVRVFRCLRRAFRSSASCRAV